ncbi:hypothetical protein [Pseudoalteromonas sp. OOF1S-7]|uniref:hypothetical protein n=1 Tax=Pseudoalteromonas sp. OOF1S-7 TaxID=2917757 RepID=UPI001EF6255F|nr:hypothetical protein [Pseudoalteromonas sp. OOF1S-7]MCG7535808.1 hypothetical protein [Pseudoalteromonas sp. OOF1S-7]
MKIEALRLASNMALTRLDNRWSLKDRIKLVAKQLKEAHTRAHKPERGHRFYLHSAAEALGFKDWREVDRIVANNPSSISDPHSLTKISHLYRDSKYYFFSFKSDCELYFFSHWHDWDKDGFELRKPVPVNEALVMNIMKTEFKTKVYVINSFHDLFHWRYEWRGSALINEHLLAHFCDEVLHPQVAQNFGQVKTNANWRYLGH